MDGAYVHIAINHFPIVLALLGAAAAVASFIWRRRALWLYAVATLTLAALSVYPVKFTGDLAEESIEKMPYATREAIHTHEEAGELAMWIVIGTGVLSAYAWWRALQSAPRDETFATPPWLRAMVTIGALASAGATSYAAKTSDPILHYSPQLPHPPAPGIPAVAPPPSPTVPPTAPGLP